MSALMLYVLGSAGALTACLLLVAGIDSRQRPLVHGVALTLAWALALAARAPSLALADAAVLLGAVGGALLLGRVLRDNAAVVAFVAAAALVDLLSFARGPTLKLLDAGSESGRSLLRYLAVSVPSAAGSIVLVGIGDLLVAGAAFAALTRLDHPRWRVGGLLVAGLAAAVATGGIVGGVAGIPFLAFAVLLEQALARRRGRVRS